MWFNVKELLPKEWEFFKLTSSYLTTVLYGALTGLVSIIFAGTISQAHLNGVGLATTLFTLVAYPFSRGYAYTFETFGPQVYGSSNPGELTTCLMKCLLQGGILHLDVLGPYGGGGKWRKMANNGEKWRIMAMANSAFSFVKFAIFRQFLILEFHI